MSSKEGGPIERAEVLIRELGIEELSKAEKYEECETIARLAPQEVVNLIDDPQVKECVGWIKEAHRDIPDNVKWRKTFAQTIPALFKEAGGIDRVKIWHELEKICDEISEKELKNVDKTLGEAIKWVQHIHDRSPERRVEIIRRIDGGGGCS
ncbi:MAG: hypothetical protein U9M97_01895 [Candidatus Hadarchaeota archaeon]|nr:hypothetical protein [Candidatus Hadarchaeota archaeon]